MGRLLAFALVRAGWQVSLFDFKQGDNCSDVAAGMLAPVAELEKNELLIYQLGREALDCYWPQILAYLKQEVYFQKKGTLVVAHPRDQAEVRHYLRLIASKLGGLSFCNQLGPQELMELEPQLAPFQQGYFIPGEGQIDSQACLKALEEDLLQRGVDYHCDSYVEAVSSQTMKLGSTYFSFDCVFDCRGLGAKSTFKDLRSLRGELIWLEAPGLKLERPIRLLHPRYSIYLVPRPDGRYLIGASEIETTDYSPISLRGALDLLTAAYSIHPGLSEARIIKMVTQCRPVLPDHLPRIRYTDGLIAVNGLYRHGFLIAPTLVAEIQRWLQGGLSRVRYPGIWEEAA